MSNMLAMVFHCGSAIISWREIAVIAIGIGVIGHWHRQLGLVMVVISARCEWRVGGRDS